MSDLYKPRSVILTEKMLPILLGDNYKHVMAKVAVHQKAGDTHGPSEVTITIKTHGDDADILGEFVAAPEVVALSFTGVPVNPTRKKEL